MVLLAVDYITFCFGERERERMMRGVCFFMGFFISLFATFVWSNAEREGVYIVYMGAPSPATKHAQIVNSLIRRKKYSVVQTYSNGFSGFAAKLSEQEAKSISQQPGVVSVFKDPILQLHTTRSWDFLKYQTAVKIDSGSSPGSVSSSGGANTVIGILDTGIWPESQSFLDVDMGPIPSRWKGACMKGLNFNTSNCNKKIIGARYYKEDGDDEDEGTVRDGNGHGTHVSSTAAGRAVSGASYYGLALGTAAGGSPGSRIAMYRVCSSSGCRGSSIMKAFDDAIADGVDVLSLSLGSSSGPADFNTDPIAIGAFHATEKGIIVACSAGNSGPSSQTVVNVAPWILTVAATTIDRDFEIKIVLGGNKIIKGGGINFSSLNKTSIYPLIDGLSAKSTCNSSDEFSARNCIPGSLDDATVKGKIVLCENEDGGYLPKTKYEFLKSQGVIGMILVDNDLRQVASKFALSPIAAVSKEDGSNILSYIKSTRNPMATILPTEVIQDYKPAPSVAYFSSRGPTYGITSLLKPDIAAPGVSIVAAWPSNKQEEALPKRDLPLFEVLSGTSMACPHVSGVAALVKSQHPTWSPAAIRSAIMTTAIQTNNRHDMITTNEGSSATPYDIGAGEISLSGPMQPGLVYETESIDYLHFLCSIGYDTDSIKRIASTIPSNFSCLGSADSDSISNMNYPSIAVSGLAANVVKTVKRTVSNVGEEESTYTPVVEAPSGLKVEVVPEKLQFTKSVKTLSFQVKFVAATSLKEALFGSVTWSNEKYKVRSPFVVSKT